MEKNILSYNHQDKEISKNDLYLNAFLRVMDEYKVNQTEDVKIYVPRAIYYGVKVVVTYPKPESQQEALWYFEFISAIKGMMSLLTPNEFMNIFPITKNYDGDKYGMKDYFYTRDYIRTLGTNHSIGENISDFLWEYWNLDILDFSVKYFSCLSDLRRYEGHLGVFEEFMASQGQKTTNTFKNSKGQAFYINKNGKPVRIAMSNHPHLKLVKS
ncbi:phage infection protein [Rummeliibacillus sp. POC4]|uniref:phage infection protein n=1 Tax=Rummeliibacillus sp. POC4 TaxID=2305899 RepID=UPI000E66FF07|nr:phage infection protein [Rummeliibacillus sp. POC4]RIJ64157.1 phage infection protein [Rummeliibacillus sp. POC4]